MEPSRFVRICPRKRPDDGSSISSAANKHLELTSGVSCAIDEPSSSRGATGFSMLTGSSSCTIGSRGAGHIQSSRPNRDHFCPIVPARVARVNREKRQAARKMRLILRQEHVPRSLSMRFTYSIPKEHMQILKATYPDRSYYGGLDYECNHCGALFWYQERVVSQSSHRAKRIAYNLCCRGGKISLPPPKPFPPILQDLIRFDGGARSNSFMRLIRQYNSLFAFTSLGANIDRSINTGQGHYVFRINGVVHHRIGSLVTAPGQRPEFAQLYIYDTANELQNRLNIFYHTDDPGDVPDPVIVQELISMLDQFNPLVQQFRLARDKLLSPSAPEIAIKLIGSDHSQSDHYSLPTISELATLIIPGASCEVSKFDVIVQKHSVAFKHACLKHCQLGNSSHLEKKKIYPAPQFLQQLGLYIFISCKMDYTMLRDVTQESHRWQVRVRVTRFSQFTTANEPDKILRLDLVLLDEQGDMMDAQIPGRHVSQFKPLLKEDAVYYIKYFEVAEARP
nr:uncharacterized protein LOC9266439 isoform X10 [Oryza sativa Japonica Group]